MNKRKTVRYPILFVLFFALSVSLFSKPALAHDCGQAIWAVDFWDLFGMTNSSDIWTIISYQTEDELTIYEKIFEASDGSAYAESVVFSDPFVKVGNGLWRIYFVNVGTTDFVFRWTYIPNGFTGDCSLKVIVTDYANLLDSSPLSTSCTSSLPCLESYSMGGGIASNNDAPGNNITVGPDDEIAVVFASKIPLPAGDIDTFTLCNLTPQGGSSAWYQKISLGVWGTWDGSTTGLIAKTRNLNESGGTIYSSVYGGDACNLPNGAYNCYEGYCPTGDCSSIYYNTTPVAWTVSGCN